jgi:hypothetical protein
MPAILKLPMDVLEFFRRQGAKGGRIGGERSLQTMTREQRVSRARTASRAAVETSKKESPKSEGLSRGSRAQAVGFERVVRLIC